MDNLNREEIRALVYEISNSISYSLKPISLREYLVNFLMSKGYSELEACDLLDNERGILAGKIYSGLKDILQEQSTKRIIPVYEFIEYPLSQEIYIKGFQIPSPRDSELKTKLRNICPFIDLIYSALHGLSPTQFELFCKKMLLLIGVNESHVTKSSGDFGIDFWGYADILSYNDDIFIYSELAKNIVNVNNNSKKFRVKIIGQAKRYAPQNFVTPKEIRELIGSYYLEKSNITSLNTNGKLAEPVIGTFITTSDYSPGSKYTADKTGVVLFSGYEIAIVLLLKGIGLSPPNTFDITDFYSWLDS